MSFEVILPFLRPIEHLILDQDISEIMVNGSSRVFIERRGHLEAVPGVTMEEKTLQIAVKNIARRLGDEISDDRPLLDSRLPDGSRVAAIFPPCSIGGTTLTIRKFAARLFTVEELLRIGTLTPAVFELLRAAIADRKNILVSGGTSTGKTTMLNALASFIDPDDRIVVIEDTAELHLEQPNLVRFEARREQPGSAAVTIRDLVKATLRHRPDRILVGEVRGAEAFDLLQALNTGHSGTLATIHANNAAQSITRLASCVLQSDVQLPFQAIRSSIGDSINVLLHIERRNGRRVVSELVEVDGYDQAKDRFEFRTHYRASEASVSKPGRSPFRQWWFLLSASALLALLRAEFLRPAHGGRSASRSTRHSCSGSRALRVLAPPEQFQTSRKTGSKKLIPVPQKSTPWVWEQQPLAI